MTGTGRHHILLFAALLALVLASSCSVSLVDKSPNVLSYCTVSVESSPPNPDDDCIPRPETPPSETSSTSSAIAVQQAN
jgi:hypothetical protein